ncbi:phosphotransferase [Actinotalea sp. Marseille-Q4924]|uniref:maltokinase N-terminal cap-like domain-containing protein n=1 Tax=Actinotalea sp. Marseille-Q4924 TaxID=2866571 RepID=UPI001CE3C0DE|nr:phosphotransferase [Actinotalea sp. Marseille-Q4924]
MTPPSTTDHPLTARPPADDGVMAALESWLPGRRWFPAKGTAGSFQRVAVLDLEDPEGQGRVGLHLLRLPSGALLQVPLVLRADDGGLPEAAVVGRTPDGTVVVDGCHDPAFVRAWLAAAERPEPGDAVGTPDLTGMRVLSGEQSNTSVILPTLDPPAILKVFRGVSTGANPDVEVPLALSEAGWRGVPRPLAWLTGAWPADPSRSEPVPGDAEATRAAETGHLGVLSELVLGAEDGFELACRYAAEGASFGALAEDLGRTTAQMHAALRSALPTASAGNAPAHGVVAVLRSRAAAAVAAAPVLADRAPAVEGLFGEVERLTDLPPLQRVHGDYHLGQVLHSADRGWSVLDFEGEPSASEAERNRPDLALRDLAGMLRSLDYAAAVGGAASAWWAEESRARLVDGYLTEAGVAEGAAASTGTAGAAAGTTTGLLRALELDKALYEVVYESRNRPSWVHIPLDGVDRLLARTR